jgi:isoleucyl-tRNA synthetase
LIGPILSFTADEAWSFHKTGNKLSSDFLLLQDWPDTDNLSLSKEPVEDAQTLLDLKESKINEALESLRSSKVIGQSLEAEIVLTYSEESKISEVLQRRQADLPEMFIVSSVILDPVSTETEIKVSAHHAPGVRCPRSWRWVPQLVDAGDWGLVSPRCAKVLSGINL